jgi:hypothetical protein
VYDATWHLILWNPLWAALFGDPSALRGRDRNVVWRHFTGLPSRVSHTPEQQARFEAAVVADLRAATAHYPADAGLHSLIEDLRSVSTHFTALWDTGTVGVHETQTKTVHHPDVGTFTLDCDPLTAPGSRSRKRRRRPAQAAQRHRHPGHDRRQPPWPIASTDDDSLRCPDNAVAGRVVRSLVECLLAEYAEEVEVLGGR